MYESLNIYKLEIAILLWLKEDDHLNQSVTVMILQLL